MRETGRERARERSETFLEKTLLLLTFLLKGKKVNSDLRLAPFIAQRCGILHSYWSESVDSFTITAARAVVQLPSVPTILYAK